MDALTIHRLHFAFTVTFHYLFPQLTMGLALLILILKTIALRTGSEHYNDAARFWSRIFGINFALGVVTGIPMEFQFGTNWAEFSRAAGGVIGQTLAMEGVFSFFLESRFSACSCLARSDWGRRAIGWRLSWSSWDRGCRATSSSPPMPGCNIRWDTHWRATAALLTSFWGLLLNPWALWQYAHNMVGAVITASFVMTAIGAFYLLSKQWESYGRTFVRVGVMVGAGRLHSSAFSHRRRARPNDGRQSAGHAGRHGRIVSRPSRARRWRSSASPIWRSKRLDNPLLIPRALSFLTYRAWRSEVRGLDSFPADDWPDKIPLLYYSYHIMVGLGTIFIAIMADRGVAAVARETL